MDPGGGGIDGPWGIDGGGYRWTCGWLPRKILVRY